MRRKHLLVDPTNVGETARKLIAVREGAAEQARALVQAAVDDGVLPEAD